jgi:transcription initiation factor TFIIE subunit alpha
MAVKGLTNTGPQSIAVNISTSDGPSAADKEAERAQKEKIAKQNALPSWMSNSTVTGESFSGTLGDGSVALKEEDKGNVASKGKAVDTNTSAQIDDIFEKLKAEQAAELAKGALHSGDEDDFDSEEEEGDEDEFEDVPATGNASSLGTPSTVAIKREASDMSPEDEGDNDGRAPKKVKVEPDIKEISAEDGNGDDTGDEDEEMEFEDI